MAEAPVPKNEAERLSALYSYDLIDRDVDVVFSNIIQIAADICDVDISVIALIDRDRQFFLARKNMKPRETPRAIAFCAHAILEPDTIFEISDATSDPRFLDNPLVTGEVGVRFYAAQPLVTKEGFALGGLCLIGRNPKSLSDVQRDTLRNLGNIIMTLFEARKSTLAAADQLKKANDELEARVQERTRELQNEMAEREALEEQFRQAQKMEAVGQLTGGIAHDFNNLLAVIMGNAEVLVERLGNDEKPAQAVMRAAQRGAELVQRLLAFSRTQSLRPQSVNIEAVAADMSYMFQRTLGTAIEVEIKVVPDLWQAMVDRSQLENVVLNLAINARDAMPGGGKLIIEIANASFAECDAAGHMDLIPGDYVVLAVSDTGTGMTREVLKQAFEPFFTTKAVGAGSGLGLSMIHGFAKQSGGEVAIDSEPGHGTTVRLYLPRAEAAVDEPRDRVTADEPMARGETVLVVEDDPDMRSLVGSVLEVLGYQVLLAEDGRTGLAALAENPSVDLLLSDVVLRGAMSGPDLADQAMHRNTGLKILFMSGYAKSGVHPHTPLPKTAEFLSKPFRKHELARKVRAALDR